MNDDGKDDGDGGDCGDEVWGWWWVVMVERDGVVGWGWGGCNGAGGGCVVCKICSSSVL
ncbi:Protein of unknown function [Gryllus bimaculatus]|nr:Protein of unknown function [Gryllus bimaculatus]